MPVTSMKKFVSPGSVGRVSMTRFWYIHNRKKAPAKSWRIRIVLPFFDAGNGCSVAISGAGSAKLIIMMALQCSPTMTSLIFVLTSARYSSWRFSYGFTTYSLKSPFESEIYEKREALLGSSQLL